MFTVKASVIVMVKNFLSEKQLNYLFLTLQKQLNIIGHEYIMSAETVEQNNIIYLKCQKSGGNDNVVGENTTLYSQLQCLQA